MNRKSGVIVGVVLIVGAFLLGFIPQYRKGKALDEQLGVVRRQLDSERRKSQMEELGLLCGHVYLETNQKNYGQASQDSTKFFDGVQDMMSNTVDVNRQSLLQKTLVQRDAVTGGLAQANPGTLSAVQDMFQHTLEAVENVSK
jgi:hypothetical protein